MRHPSKSGFTLVELLVVIAIIGTLVGLLLPAVQAAREAARNNTCKNNLTQLAKSLANRESSLGDFPGYINNLGTKGTANQIRASWVVFLFPYMEQAPLWERWSQPDGTQQNWVTTGQGAFTPEIELLICPSDPPVTPGRPNLSYAANSGWLARTDELISSIGGAMPPESPSANNTTQENPANGVFFDRSRVPTSPPAADLVGPTNSFDMNQPLPLSMTMSYIQQKGDGASSTIMLTENLHQVFWAFVDQADYDPSATSFDEKYHFGVCWEQPNVIVDSGASDDEKARRINGDTTEDPYEKVVDITTEDSGSAGAHRRAMPSSRHPGGVNVAYVGQAVRFLAESIEPRIYAQLMTSNRNRSDLVFGSSPATAEAQMAPVSDSDF